MRPYWHCAETGESTWDNPAEEDNPAQEDNSLCAYADAGRECDGTALAEVDRKQEDEHANSLIAQEKWPAEI